MFTHTLTRGWSSAGASINKSVAVNGGGENNIDESIPASSTDLVVEFAADVSQIKSLFIVADGDLTIHTNSNGSPANTFTLSANTPFCWIYGDAPLRDTGGSAVTTDITALHVVNASSDTAAQLQIRCLVDPTV